MNTAYLVFVLGILSAFGPFVIDMYLPALPEMTQVFDCSTASVQLGLTFCMVGLAVGQLFLGPMSDKYGRKSVLYLSLLLYIAATFLCCLSESIEFFTFARFLQGLGGSGAIVYSRSCPTDLYSGRQLAKMIAIVGAVNGIAPVAAPVIGGFCAKFIGWRGIFYALLGIGIVVTAMVIPVKETLPKSKRIQGSLLTSFKGFLLVYEAPGFGIYSTVFGLSMAALFAYISSTPFILQDFFGVSQLTFSLIFALNAVGIAIGAMLALKVSTTQKASFIGSLIGFLCAAAGLCICYFHQDMYIYEASIFLMLFFFGFIFTGATATAMNAGRKYAGAASAVIGAVGFIFGGLVSPIVSWGTILFTSFIICTIALGLSTLLLLVGGEKKHGVPVSTTNNH